MRTKTATATGPKGFLKWLRRYNPQLYQHLAPGLPSNMPQLFAQFEAAGGLKGLAMRQRARRRMGALGTGFTGFSAFTGMTDSGGGTGFTGGATNFSTNAGQTAMATNFATQSTAATTATAATPSTGSTTGNTAAGAAGGFPSGAAAGAAGPLATDVSDAANSGTLSSADAAALAAAVGTSIAALSSTPVIPTPSAARATQAAVATQLRRAASGQAPLPIPALSGTPGARLGLTMSSTDWWLIAGAGVGVLYLATRKKRV